MAVKTGQGLDEVKANIVEMKAVVELRLGELVTEIALSKQQQGQLIEKLKAQREDLRAAFKEAIKKGDSAAAEIHSLASKVQARVRLLEKKLES